MSFIKIGSFAGISLLLAIAGAASFNAGESLQDDCCCGQLCVCAACDCICLDECCCDGCDDNASCDCSGETCTCDGSCCCCACPADCCTTPDAESGLAMTDADNCCSSPAACCGD